MDVSRLDLNRIKVNAKDINSVNAIERHEANKLAGICEFQDTYTAGGTIKTYQVGHRVPGHRVKSSEVMLFEMIGGFKVDSGDVKPQQQPAWGPEWRSNISFLMLVLCFWPRFSFREEDVVPG